MVIAKRRDPAGLINSSSNSLQHPQSNGHPNPNPSKVDAENSLDLASSSIDELDETIQNLMLELVSESEATQVSATALNARIIELLQEYEDDLAEEKALRAELHDLEDLQSQMDLEDFQDET